MNKRRLALLLVLPFLGISSGLAQEAPKKATAKVYIGGVGIAPYLQSTLDELTDFLADKKVSVKQMDGDSKSRSNYVERLSSLGGESLLYITVDIADNNPKDTLKVQCFDTQGKMLWEEETKTGLIVMSSSSAAKSLVGKMKKKLESHVGKLGLPVS